MELIFLFQVGKQELPERAPEALLSWFVLVMVIIAFRWDALLTIVL